jgi:hypothetical protein
LGPVASPGVCSGEAGASVDCRNRELCVFEQVSPPLVCDSGVKGAASAERDVLLGLSCSGGRQCSPMGSRGGCLLAGSQASTPSEKEGWVGTSLSNQSRLPCPRPLIHCRHMGSPPPWSLGVKTLGVRLPGCQTRIVLLASWATVGRAERPRMGSVCPNPCRIACSHWPADRIVGVVGRADHRSPRAEEDCGCSWSMRRRWRCAACCTGRAAREVGIPSSRRPSLPLVPSVLDEGMSEEDLWGVLIGSL